MQTWTIIRRYNIDICILQNTIKPSQELFSFLTYIIPTVLLSDDKQHFKNSIGEEKFGKYRRDTGVHNEINY